MKLLKNLKSPIFRVIIIGILITTILGIVVKAGNVQIQNITIKYANGSETNIITSKTKVSEIIEENHIVILEDETVIPSLDDEIEEDKTIRIVKKEENISKKSNENTDIMLDEILLNYAPIVEKIVVEQVEIPFETITKDVSNGATDTTNRIIQNGKNGVREVTFKIKYRNDIEIEREELSSVIIKEPTDKIVQVSQKTTSRSGTRLAKTNPATESSSSIAARVSGITPYVKTMNASAYCSCSKCCGKSNGITSSGAYASEWYTVAAGSGYEIGTVIYIPYFSNKPNQGWFVVQDRGGAISNSKLDIFMGTHSQALNFGRRNLECYIYEF